VIEEAEVVENRTTVLLVSGKFLLFCALALLCAMIAGFQWLGESRDFYEYFIFYENLESVGDLNIYRYEPGFILTALFSKTCLGFGFSQYYFIVALLSLALKFRLLHKHASCPLLAAIVYLGALFPLHEYTQIRAALAFAFAYTAVDEYIEGKRLRAVVLMLLGTIFHYTVLVIAAAVVPAIMLRIKRTASFKIVLLAIYIGFYWLLSKTIQLSANLNPLIEGYWENISFSESPTILSGKNVLLIGAFTSGAYFLRPWTDPKRGLYFILSSLVFMFYAFFYETPVFAHRFQEEFTFFFFLYAFRMGSNIKSRVPAIFMSMMGMWMFYRAFTENIISL
jgi:hypothetical protein